MPALNVAPHQARQIYHQGVHILAFGGWGEAGEKRSVSDGANAVFDGLLEREVARGTCPWISLYMRVCYRLWGYLVRGESSEGHEPATIENSVPWADPGFPTGDGAHGRRCHPDIHLTICELGKKFSPIRSSRHEWGLRLLTVMALMKARAI